MAPDIRSFSGGVSAIKKTPSPLPLSECSKVVWKKSLLFIFTYGIVLDVLFSSAFGF